MIYGLDAVKVRLDRLPVGVYQDGVHGLSTQIPVKDESFDVVVAGEFIEHIYQKDVDSTLGEIFRVLKIGGRLLRLTTPNPYDWKRRLRGKSVLGGAHVSQHFTDCPQVEAQDGTTCTGCTTSLMQASIEYPKPLHRPKEEFLSWINFQR